MFGLDDEIQPEYKFAVQNHSIMSTNKFWFSIVLKMNFGKFYSKLNCNKTNFFDIIALVSRLFDSIIKDLNLWIYSLVLGKLISYLVSFYLNVKRYPLVHFHCL